MLFDNGNGSIAKGGMTQCNSALTKNVIRNHIEFQRNIAKLLQVSKLSWVENTTLRSLPGLAVNPKSTPTMLEVDDVSLDDEDDESMVEEVTFDPMETAELGNDNATAPVLLPFDIKVSSKKHQLTKTIYILDLMITHQLISFYCCKNLMLLSFYLIEL